MTDDQGQRPSGDDPPPRDPSSDGATPLPVPPPSLRVPPPGRPGASSFTIEGRAAPGLFVVGWLASILGLGITIVGVMSGGSGAQGPIFLTGVVLLSIGIVSGAGAQAIERRASGRTDYAGPSPVLVFLASVPLTLAAALVLIVPLYELGLDPHSPLASLIAILITAVVYGSLVRLLVVGPGALTWSEMGVRMPRPAVVREIGWGAILGFGILFPTGLLGALLAQFWTVPEDVLPRSGDATGLVVNLLTAAVVAPIGEELFFRGYVTTAWLRADGERAALIRGAILFAGAHILTVAATSAGEGLQQAAFAFIVRLPVALALGWLYIRTRSLYGPIALHAVFNGIQVLALEARGVPG